MNLEDNEESENWDADLKYRERIFVLNYCTNDECFLNATKSYRETYTKQDKESGKLFIPDQKTCEVNGSRLCKRERVKIAIRRLLKLTQSELDEEHIYQAIKDLCTLSFYNPADILTAKGNLKVKRLEDLGDLAKCIAQITPTMYGTKYTLYDRNKAMSQLLNYLNIIRPENQVDIKLPVIEMVQKAADIESWNTKTEEQT